MYDYQIDLIEKSKEKLEIDSDYGLAKYLGINPSNIYNWRANRSTIDASTAYLFAQILEIDVAEIMIKVERRQSYIKRWKRGLKMARSAAACVILSCGIYAGSAMFTTSPAEASDLTTYTLCAMLLLLYFSMTADSLANGSHFYNRLRNRLANQ